MTGSRALPRVRAGGRSEVRGCAQTSQRSPRHLLPPSPLARPHARSTSTYVRKGKLGRVELLGANEEGDDNDNDSSARPVEADCVELVKVAGISNAVPTHGSPVEEEVDAQTPNQRRPVNKHSLPWRRNIVFVEERSGGQDKLRPAERDRRSDASVSKAIPRTRSSGERAVGQR